MRLELVPRTAPSRMLAILSPLIAFAVTLLIAAMIFAWLGASPLRALAVYFVEPLTAAWSVQELLVKAAPLILIAVGLTACYRSGNWNIGAEGQLTVGAIAGGAIPVLMPGLEGPLVLPSMLLTGMLGGALYAAVPAILKNRFGANEILTSLMLVYVALLVLDWLVRGPWRDPMGFNFPETRLFGASATVPSLVDGTRLHLGVLLAPLVAVLGWAMLRYGVAGFAVDLSGTAPRAGRFAGFDARRVTLATFLASGALAGLAGILEAAGTIGQLRPEISPGYGFTAIVVAFLGRLDPLGAVLAGLVLALTYLGGEGAQASLGVSSKATSVIQGVLLFSILAADTLVRNRVRLRRRQSEAAA